MNVVVEVLSEEPEGQAGGGSCARRGVQRVRINSNEMSIEVMVKEYKTNISESRNARKNNYAYLSSTIQRLTPKN